MIGTSCPIIKGFALAIKAHPAACLSAMKSWGQLRLRLHGFAIKAGHGESWGLAVMAFGFIKKAIAASEARQ